MSAAHIFIMLIALTSCVSVSQLTDCLDRKFHQTFKDNKNKLNYLCQRNIYCVLSINKNYKKSSAKVIAHVRPKTFRLG